MRYAQSTLRVLLASALLTTMSLAAPVTVVLQNGLNNYTGCVDRELRYQTSPFSDTGILVEEK